MSERIFLDTNIAVYLFDNDSPEKQTRSREIFSNNDLRSRVIVSTQVLQEFYVAVTRKLAVPLEPSSSKSRTTGRLYKYQARTLNSLNSFNS